VLAEIDAKDRVSAPSHGGASLKPEACRQLRFLLRTACFTCGDPGRNPG